MRRLICSSCARTHRQRVCEQRNERCCAACLTPAACTSGAPCSSSSATSASRLTCRIPLPLPLPSLHSAPASRSPTHARAAAIYNTMAHALRCRWRVNVLRAADRGSGKGRGHELCLHGVRDAVDGGMRQLLFTQQHAASACTHTCTRRRRHMGCQTGCGWRWQVGHRGQWPRFGRLQAHAHAQTHMGSTVRAILEDIAFPPQQEAIEAQGQQWQGPLPLQQP